MFTLEGVGAELRRLPTLVRIGLALTAFAGLADIVAHLGVAEAAASMDGHTASAAAAHATGFVGMVVILLGVVLDGRRATRPGRPAADTTTGGS